MKHRRATIGAAVAIALGVLVWWLARPARDDHRGGDGKPAVGDPAPPMADDEHGRSAGLWHRPRREGAAAVPDPEGSIRLEGQVIDQAQHPVAGATVVLSSTPIQLAVTEDDGSFAFEGLLARSYRIGAHRDGDRAEPVDVRVRDDVEPVILRLHAGITLVVTVVDRETRAPIAGATVTTGRLLEQEAVTGADGVATLRGLGSWFNNVLVEADGYSPVDDGFTLPDDPGGRFEHTVEVGRGAAVSGVVRTPDGKGMPDTVVQGATTSGVGALRAETDADGRWTIPAVAAGEWVFTSPGEQFAPGRSESVTVDGVTATDGVIVQLVAGMRITGVVIGPDGAPVPHAAIAFAAGDLANTASAGDHGEFELLGLPRARYVVVARESDRSSTPIDADVRIDDVVDLRVPIADATIRGVVVDSAGEPVAEAAVGAMPSGSYLFLFEDTRAITDSAGRWTIGPLSAAGYQLRADWPDAGNSNLYVRPEAATAKPGDRDVRIVLPAAATLRGTVMRGGVPVTRYAIGIGTGEGMSGFETPQMVSKPDGRFERSGLPPGTYSLTLGGADFARTTVSGIVVVAGEVKDLGAISVEAGRTVRGRVVDAAGEPVAGATVAVARFFVPRDGGLGLDEDPMKNALMNARSAQSGADGRFELIGVAPAERRGALQCLADKRGVGRSREIPLPEGDAELTLTLEATGAIAVTVSRGGTAADRLTIDATEIDGTATAHAYGGQAGSIVRLDGLVPGTYSVRAMSMQPQRTTPPSTVTVTAGATATVTVAFASGGITVIVVPLVPCQYLVLSKPAEGEGADSMVSVDPCAKDVPLEIEHVEPGPYEVCIDQTCQPITVAATPATQTFRVKKP